VTAFAGAWCLRNNVFGVPLKISHLMRLPQLAPNAVARVTELSVEDSDATRLKAMGICVGRRLQLVRAGDPLIVRVLGARVGLSARLADGVSVEPTDEPD